MPCFMVTSGLERDEVSNDVAFLGRGALARQDILAVAAEPLVDFGRVRQTRGVGDRCQRLDRLARHRMAACDAGIEGVAGTAAPLLAMPLRKERLAALDREAGEGGLLGAGGQLE